MFKFRVFYETLNYFCPLFLPRVFLHFRREAHYYGEREREREMGGACILPSGGVGKTTTQTTTSTFTTTTRRRRSSRVVVSAAQRKKSNQKKMDKTKTEFIEQEDAKLAMFERAQAATRRRSSGTRSASTLACSAFPSGWAA